MADDLDRRIAAFQRDVRYRQVLIVAVVVGIFAGIAGGFVLPSLLGVGTIRDGAMLGYFVMPFAICMGLGYAVYGALRRWRP